MELHTTETGVQTVHLHSQWLLCLQVCGCQGAPVYHRGRGYCSVLWWVVLVLWRLQYTSESCDYSTSVWMLWKGCLPQRERTLQCTVVSGFSLATTVQVCVHVKERLRERMLQCSVVSGFSLMTTVQVCVHAKERLREKIQQCTVGSIFRPVTPGQICRVNRETIYFRGRERILQCIVWSIFNPVTPEQVCRVYGDVIYFRGRVSCSKTLTSKINKPI